MSHDLDSYGTEMIQFLFWHCLYSYPTVSQWHRTRKQLSVNSQLQ